MISPTQRPLPDNTQHSQETDTHAPRGIRTRSPSMRAAADPHLRPQGHWDLLAIGIYHFFEDSIEGNGEVLVKLNETNVKGNDIFKFANSEEKPKRWELSGFLRP